MATELRKFLLIRKNGLVRVGLSHLKKAHFKVGDKVTVSRKNNTQFEIVLDENGSKVIGNYGVNISSTMTTDYHPSDKFEITYGTNKILLTWLAY